MTTPSRAVIWTPHRDPFERAASAFSASYMSDAKWRKALGAIADAGLSPGRATWKFIDSAHLHEWGIPGRSDLLPTRLADGRFPPEEYRWIEWIRFPHDWRPVPDVAHSVAQDIEGLKRALEAVGRFQYAEDEGGFTLYGYRRGPLGVQPPT